MRGNIGQKFVRPWMVFLERGGVPELYLVEDALGIDKGVAGSDRSLRGVQQGEGGLSALDRHQVFVLRFSVGKRLGKGVQNTPVITSDGDIAGDRGHQREQHDANQNGGCSSAPVWLR